jgi:hypothetical protein
MRRMVAALLVKTMREQPARPSCSNARRRSAVDRSTAASGGSGARG